MLLLALKKLSLHWREKTLGFALEFIATSQGADKKIKTVLTF